MPEVTANFTWGDEDLVARVLATGERRTLVRDAADGRYVPGGLLVFLRRGVLFAVPFDAFSLEVRGQPVPLLEGVAQALTYCSNLFVTGAGQFALSSGGTLAYLASAVLPYPEASLVSVDRKGRVSPLPAPPRSYVPNVSVSPDGRRLPRDCPST